jgi:hypothetical protein
LNTNETKDSSKEIALNDLFSNIQIALCIHFSYIYFLHSKYFSASNYIDALENSLEPEPNSQYWVAPIVQEIFNKYIKMYNLDLKDYILNLKLMELE